MLPRMSETRKAWIVLACCASLAVAGICSCTRTYQARKVKPSGFLDDYSQLHEGKGDQALLVYLKPGVDWASYKKIIIDPVEVWRKPGSKLEKVDRDDLQKLAGYMHQGITSRLGNDYEIVTQPSPGTLRLRPAITEAQKSHVVLDFVTNVVPVGLAISFADRLATGAHTFVGRAAVEAEIIDASTGERLWAAVDARTGRKILRGKFRAWDDVKSAYDEWGDAMAARLTELRAGQESAGP